MWPSRWCGAYLDALEIIPGKPIAVLERQEAFDQMTFTTSGGESGSENRSEHEEQLGTIPRAQRTDPGPFEEQPKTIPESDYRSLLIIS